MKKQKKHKNDTLQRHSDVGYIQDLKHLCTLGKISSSKRDWIETTMLRLRETANIYEKKFGAYLLARHVEFIHQAPFVLSDKIYFADFYLPQHHLIVEIDGDYHQGITQSEYDKIRDASFNGHKVKVLRIPNSAVMNQDALNIFISQYLPTKHVNVVNKGKNTPTTVLYNRLHKTLHKAVKMNVRYVINNRTYIASIAIKSLNLVIEVVDDDYEVTHIDKCRDMDFASINFTTLRYKASVVETKVGKAQIVAEILGIRANIHQQRREQRQQQNTNPTNQ